MATGLLRQSAKYRYGRALKTLAGPLVSLLTIVIMLVGVEVYFRYYYKQSDGFNMTLVGKNWYWECWNPTYRVTHPDFATHKFSFVVNDPTYQPEPFVQYRDREWTAADVAGKTSVFVLGDSFAAGHGLCDVAERFSDRLGAQLGNAAAVLNLAHNGWSTSDMIYYTERYPLKPNVVILSYFINDIDGAIRVTPNTTLTVPGLHIPAESPLVDTLRGRSFAFNFFYWHVLYKNYHLEDAQTITRTYLDAYNDPAVWETHRAELLALVAWAKQHNAPLVVVTWPLLGDFSLSASALGKVEALLEAEGVTIVRAAEMLKGDAPADLIISSIDAHPNAYANGKIADALLEVVKPLVR